MGVLLILPFDSPLGSRRFGVKATEGALADAETLTSAAALKAVITRFGRQYRRIEPAETRPIEFDEIVNTRKVSR